MINCQNQISFLFRHVLINDCCYCLPKCLGNVLNKINTKAVLCNGRMYFKIFQRKVKMSNVTYAKFKSRQYFSYPTNMDFEKHIKKIRKHI